MLAKLFSPKAIIDENTQNWIHDTFAWAIENFDINDGLPGNVVLRFYPQENGQIWAYALHKRALFYFNEEYKGFTPYKYNDKISNFRRRCFLSTPSSFNSALSCFTASIRPL